MSLPDPWSATTAAPIESGQAVVYQVTRTGDSARYALKRLRNPKRTPRFRREIAVMEALHATGARVPLLVDSGVDARQRLFLVMPWYERGSLEALLRSEPDADAATSLRLVDQVGAELEAMHAAGFAHRDLKPANVLLDDAGACLLTDFGLALAVDDEEERLTETDEGVGSRFYIAPENEAGFNPELDQRPADSYAFGKLLWAVVARKVALAREDQLLSQHRLAVTHDDPRLAPLDALCDLLLARDPRSRMTNWDDIRGEIDNVRQKLSGGEAAAPVDGSWLVGAEQSLGKLLATKDIQDAARRRRDDDAHKAAWNKIRAALSRQTTESLGGQTTRLTEQAREAGLSFRVSTGGPYLDALAAAYPLNTLDLQGTPIWALNEGSPALVTASGELDPLPQALYIGQYPVPVEGRLHLVRVPMVFSFPGAHMTLEAAASPAAAHVVGPPLLLASAVDLALQFAAGSAEVIGQTLVRYLEAILAASPIRPTL